MKWAVLVDGGKVSVFEADDVAGAHKVARGAGRTLLGMVLEKGVPDDGVYFTQTFPRSEHAALCMVSKNLVVWEETK